MMKTSEDQKRRAKKQPWISI